MCYITAELGRALAVVKVASQVNENTQFSGSGHPRTVSAIKMQFGTIDYVGEGNPQPTFGNNRTTGASPHMHSPNNFLFFFNGMLF